MSPEGLSIRVAQTIPRTSSEGPGERFALWVQGCSLRCPGCCNPEMFPAAGGSAQRVASILEEVLATATEGISVLGGEPFEQAAGVAALAEGVRAAGRTVMVFSGYTREELEARRSEAGVGALLDACDLLVDGRFERGALDTRRRFIGSSNQRMHFLTQRYRADDPRFVAPNTAEIRFERGVLTVHGWPALASGFRARRGA